MAGADVVILNDVNFETEVVQSKVPVLVDFTATWCRPCQAIAPIVDELATEYRGKVKVAKLDIDESPGLASRFGVRGVPTLFMFKAGEVFSKHVGVMSKRDMNTFVGGAL